MKIVPRVLNAAEWRKYQQRVFDDPHAAGTENVHLPAKAEFDIRTPHITDPNDKEQMKPVFQAVRAFGTMVTHLMQQRDIEFADRKGSRPYDHEYVIGEALKNAILHGNKDPETGLPDPKKIVVLRWALDKVRTKAGQPQRYQLHLHFRDQGEGIKQEETKDAIRIESLDDIDALTPDQVERLMAGRGHGLGKGLSGIREIVSLRGGKEEHVTKDHRWTQRGGSKVLVPTKHTHRIMLPYQERESQKRP